MKILPYYFVMCITIMLFFFSSTTGSEIYKWIDENGVIHFSDNLENIPPSQRGKEMRIPIYDRNDISPNKSYDNIPKNQGVPNEEAVDQHLRRIWRDHINALRRGDVQTALTHIHPHNREQYREMFSVLKDKLQDILKTHDALKKESIGENTAVYRLTTRENGVPYAYDVTFGLDTGGNWKIIEY